MSGMEKDDEIKGAGNSYDFGARVYDPRIGRWLSRDKYEYIYMMWSPYLYSGNSPISYSDIEGNWVKPKFESSANEQKYNTVMTSMQTHKFMNANYTIIHKQSRMDKLSSRLGLTIPSTCPGLTYHVIVREMTEAEMGTAVSLVRVGGGRGARNNAAGFYRLKSLNVRKWTSQENNRTVVKGMYIDGEVALGTESYNLATIGEELLHAGQRRFYLNENKVISSLHMEVEAKFIKVVDYLNNFSDNYSDGAGADQLYNSMISKGYQDYEISFIFQLNDDGTYKLDADGHKVVDTEMVGAMKSDANGMNQNNTDQKETILKGIRKLKKSVDKVYTNVPNWSSNQTIDESLPYYKELKKKAN